MRALAAASLLPRRTRPDAVLVHMVPLFVLLVAPLAKLLRVPLFLWYTHWNAGRSLRLATAARGRRAQRQPRLVPARDLEAARRPGMRSTSRASRRRRLRRPTARSGSWRWAGRRAGRATTRCSQALELATERGLDAQLEIRGPQLTEDEQAHRHELEAIVAESDVLRDRVRIEPPLARDEIPARLRAADALLSATQPRESETLDKVVYEAAACGVPVIASNTALDEFLGGLPVELRFKARDAEGLAETLLAFAAAGPTARRDAGAELRRRVVAGHSVESWADAVTEIIAAQTRE